ncbi:MAG: hypothetical protein AAF409_06755 [Pseudomonadota bacterium]
MTFRLIAAVLLAAGPAFADPAPDTDERAILALLDTTPAEISATEDDDLPAYLTESPVDEPAPLTLTLVDDAAL